MLPLTLTSIVEASGDLTAREWIERYCSIMAPGRGIQPLVPYPYQAKIWDDGSRQRIVLKSRQMGVSRALACEAAWFATTRPGSTVLFVSRGLQAARNLLRYAWQSIEPAVRAGDLARPTRRNTTSLEWETIDSRIVSLSASPDAARSYAATAVYLDEAAYLPWAEEIYQSLAPTVSTGGRMTVVSTPHGRGNLFHRLWECEEGRAAGSAERAARDPSCAANPGLDGWSRHRVHWSERPEYTPEWAEKERRRHTSRSWAEEYELSFESSGNSVFSEQHILRMLAGGSSSRLRPSGAPVPTGTLAAGGDEEKGGPFFAGLDLARYTDYTALAILDSDGRLVALERFNQAGWTVQVERVAAALAAFAGVHVVCDATAAGDPVFGMLQQKAAATGGPGAAQAWTAESFIYTSDSRAVLMDTLVLAVEGGQIGVVADPSFQDARDVLVGEMRAFRWDITPGGRARPSHPPGGHDDCVQALAMAWKGLLEWRNRRPDRTEPALVAVAGRGMRRW